jgi:hypothetical protein
MTGNASFIDNRLDLRVIIDFFLFTGQDSQNDQATQVYFPATHYHSFKIGQIAIR